MATNWDIAGYITSPTQYKSNQTAADIFLRRVFVRKGF